MRVTCEQCLTAWQVDESRVPLGGARATCPHCGGTIVVPGAGGASAPGPAPAPAGGPDFGRTIAFDFSQVAQEGDEAQRLLAEAPASRAFLTPGVSYALRESPGGELHPISSPVFVIGRSGGGMVVADPEISRRHCEVRVMGDHLVLADLDSTNGTFVRGERVRAARLTPGQSFAVGNTTLEFVAARAGKAGA